MPDIRHNIFNSRIKHLQEMGKTHSTIGHDILRDLWDIYKSNLWKTEEYNWITTDGEKVSERFETFGEFCEVAIRPFYDPADYFDKFYYVIDRVFRYVFLRIQQDDPILLPDGSPLTVEALIDADKWISKLIIISNAMEACETDNDIESLFNAGFEGGVEDVKETKDRISNNRVVVTIPYTERVLPDNHYTLLFEDIDEEQYQIIRKKMGRIIKVQLD